MNKLCLIILLSLNVVFAVSKNQCLIEAKLPNGETLILDSKDKKAKEEVLKEPLADFEHFQRSVSHHWGINTDIVFSTRLSHMMNVEAVLKEIELERLDQGKDYPIYSYTVMADEYVRWEDEFVELVTEMSEAVLSCYWFLQDKNVTLNGVNRQERTKRNMSYPGDYPKPCLKLCIEMSLPKVGKTYQNKINSNYLPHLRKELNRLIQVKYEEPRKQQSYEEQKDKIKEDYKLLKVEYSKKYKRFYELDEKKKYEEAFANWEDKRFRYERQRSREAKRTLKKEIYPYYDDAKKDYEEIKRRFEPIRKEYENLSWKLRRIEDIKKGEVQKEIDTLRGIISRLAGPQLDRV